ARNEEKQPEQCTRSPIIQIKERSRYWQPWLHLLCLRGCFRCSGCMRRCSVGVSVVCGVVLLAGSPSLVACDGLLPPAPVGLMGCAEDAENCADRPCTRGRAVDNKKTMPRTAAMALNVRIVVRIYPGRVERRS